MSTKHLTQYRVRAFADLPVERLIHAKDAEEAKRLALQSGVWRFVGGKVTSMLPEGRVREVLVTAIGS